MSQECTGTAGLVTRRFYDAEHLAQLHLALFGRVGGASVWQSGSRGAPHTWPRAQWAANRRSVSRKPRATPVIHDCEALPKVRIGEKRNADDDVIQTISIYVPPLDAPLRDGALRQAGGRAEIDVDSSRFG